MSATAGDGLAHGALLQLNLVNYLIKGLFVLLVRVVRATRDYAAFTTRIRVDVLRDDVRLVLLALSGLFPF